MSHGVVLRDKILHGMYNGQIAEVATLTDTNETLIITAQELAIKVKWTEAGVCHSRQDPRCRICKEASETEIRVLANQPDISVVDQEQTDGGSGDRHSGFKWQEEGVEETA